MSHKTSIDSQFLDEGLGSPEIALTALDSLNASGKMIGIICHVEELKERITTHIGGENPSPSYLKLEGFLMCLANLENVSP